MAEIRHSQAFAKCSILKGILLFPLEINVMRTILQTLKTVKTQIHSLCGISFSMAH
jgi:hypothetical protein